MRMNGPGRGRWSCSVYVRMEVRRELAGPTAQGGVERRSTSCAGRLGLAARDAQMWMRFVFVAGGRAGERWRCGEGTSQSSGL